MYSFIDINEILNSHDAYLNQLCYDGENINITDKGMKCLLNNSIIYNPKASKNEKYFYLLLYYMENNISVIADKKDLSLSTLYDSKNSLKNCKNVLEKILFICKRNEDINISEIKNNIILQLSNALLYDYNIPYDSKATSYHKISYIRKKYSQSFPPIKTLFIMLDEKSGESYLYQKHID